MRLGDKGPYSRRLSWRLCPQQVTSPRALAMGSSSCKPRAWLPSRASCELHFAGLRPSGRRPRKGASAALTLVEDLLVRDTASQPAIWQTARE